MYLQEKEIDVSPSSPTPRIPMPPAVELLTAQQMPESTIESMGQLLDAERELQRLRAPLSVKDQGDRETALALFAVADKALCSVPCLISAATGSLS